MKDIVSQLQLLILEKRTEKLSPYEIKELLLYPYEPEIVMMLYLACKNNILTGDEVLVHLIPIINNNSDLITASICIKNNFNPNYYIDTPEIGNIHILGYIHYRMEVMKTEEDEKERRRKSYLITTLIIMLIISGSNPSLPVFQGSKKKVIDWINEQDYDTILNDVDKSNYLKLVSVDTLRLIGLMLDIPELLIPSIQTDKEKSVDFFKTPKGAGKNKPYLKNAEIPIAIQSFSYNVLKYIDYSDLIIDIMDYIIVTKTITYLNYTAFKYFANQDILPSYILITEMLIQLVYYQQDNNILSFQTIKEMLIIAINNGCQLDKYQMNIISGIGKDNLDEIISEYQQRKWKKICVKHKIEHEITEENKRLFTALDINVGYPEKIEMKINTKKEGEEDNKYSERAKSVIEKDEGELDSDVKNPLTISIKRKNIIENREKIKKGLNKDKLCSFIDKLVVADLDVLKNSFIKKREMQVNYLMGYPTEFISERGPQLECNNDISGSPYDYSDVYVTFYRDEDGELWCFTSDMYETLCDRKINVYNEKVIASYIIYLMNAKLKYLKSLGISNFEPITFSSAIDTITSPDVISNDESNKSIEIFADKLSVTIKYLKNLSMNDINTILNKIGVSLDLEYLTKDHALVILSRIGNTLSESKVKAIKITLDSIKML